MKELKGGSIIRAAVGARSVLSETQLILIVLIQPDEDGYKVGSGHFPLKKKGSGHFVVLGLMMLCIKVQLMSSSTFPEANFGPMMG